FRHRGLPAGRRRGRPLSVYRAIEDRIEVILQAVGAGTAQLLALREGGSVSCLGPLGRGFEIKSGGRSAVLISGGLGVAPMPVAARDARAAGLQVTWVHGARSAGDLCSGSHGDAVIVATDDGSAGVAGPAVAAAARAEPGRACGADPRRGA